MIREWLVSIIAEAIMKVLHDSGVIISPIKKIDATVGNMHLVLERIEIDSSRSNSTLEQ